MRITSGQIRAARAFIGVNLNAMSDGAGISSTTLNKAEQGGEVTETVVNKIEEYVNDKGYEFTEHGGVRPKQGTRTLIGSAGIIEFLDDVYLTIKKRGGDIFLRNAPDADFMRWTDVLEFSDYHMNRMVALKNYKFRILVEEGDHSTVSSKYAEYRWIPSRYHGSVPIYGYGDKVALLDLKGNPVIQIIDNKNMAQGLKSEFDELWRQSKQIK